MSENGSGVVDTGADGGTLFDVIWSSDDPLSGGIAPRRYGRVDIDYGGDKLAEGVIVGINEARDESQAPVAGAWVLRIAVGGADALPVARAVARQADIAVRVHS